MHKIESAHIDQIDAEYEAWLAGGGEQIQYEQAYWTWAQNSLEDDALADISAEAYDDYLEGFHTND